MQPRNLSETADRAERLAESLTGMLIDHTTRPGMYTAGFRQRADTVLSILDEIGRAYSEYAFVD
ncbi:MAG: hypothetical protein HYS53_01995, partial [Candidatus Aenigmarchaeota archaeon]|nr:hypothetical protein [Candidatus Aenigmarchaeota archaeon]